MARGYPRQTRCGRFRHPDRRLGNQWKTVFEGTRIGRAFSREFEPVTAQAFRLNILEATDAPHIEEMQLLSYE